MPREIMCVWCGGKRIQDVVCFTCHGFKERNGKPCAACKGVGTFKEKCPCRCHRGLPGHDAAQPI